MPARFRHLGFGPLELRPLLRAHLDPDERIVGWATSSPDEPLSLTLLRLAAFALPGLGHLIVAGISSAFSPSRTLMLLSDRRLLLIERDRAGTLALTHHIPLEQLSVASAALGVTFIIGHAPSPSATPNDSPALAILAPQTIDANQCIPAARLHQALLLLAREPTTPSNDAPPSAD